MPADEYDEFEAIAIGRDLMRRPQIATLALSLARLNAPTGVVVHKDKVPPLYITLAYRILSRRDERIALVSLIDLLSD